YIMLVIMNRDYPMLQAVNLLIAAFVVFVNLLVDITYGYLDPRIRYA
ncbi:MAG: ABC transporter permease, partial [Chloroflexi bacterium]|nr:ABC transporter permease [Chloroflexota bacterium]